MLNLIVVNYNQKNALIMAAFIWLIAGCGVEPGSLLVTPSPIPSEPPAATLAVTPTSHQEAHQEALQAAQITPGVICIVKTGTNGGALHVRGGAGVEYQVLGYAAEGDTLTVLETAGHGWHKVNTPAGLTGWVNSVYCRKD